MFIVQEVVEGNKWYVAYEGKSVPNAEGGQELEMRAAVFRTSASFWEIGVHEWETNDVPSRATYTEEGKEPQWQGSGFMVCTRRNVLAALAGRSDACGVCVCGTTGVLHLWT